MAENKDTDDRFADGEDLTERSSHQKKGAPAKAKVNSFRNDDDENDYVNPEAQGSPTSIKIFFKTLLRYFISGVVVLLPLVVTSGIVLWLTNFFIKWLGPSTAIGKVLSRLGINFVPGEKLPYIYGWLIVLIFLFVLGFMVEVVFRKKVIEWFDTFIGKIPLIGKVYGTTRKFTDLMKKSGKDEVHNMSPVYCRFGGEGGVIVLALLPNNKIYQIDGHEYQVVIVPTAPVPFGGGMFFIPRENILPAQDMTIDALMTFYVSMGVQ